MRAPMDDHQFALAAREQLGKATNAEAYDALVDSTNARAEAVAQREEAVAAREESVAAREETVVQRETAAAPVQ